MNNVTVYLPTTFGGLPCASGAQTTSTEYASIGGTGAQVLLPIAPMGGTINVSLGFEGTANLLAGISVPVPYGLPVFFPATGGSAQGSLPEAYAGSTAQVVIASADGTPAIIRKVNLSATAQGPT